MAKLSIVKFKGASGRQYTFDVFPIDTIWNDGIGAVYFVTHRSKGNDGKHYHQNIYVGQTSDLKSRHQNHHRKQCFDQHEANTLCILRESSERSRLAIERDLIEGCSPLCNR